MFGTTKKPRRCGELLVSALSFSPVPREIVGELSSFSLKSLGFSKSDSFLVLIMGPILEMGLE